MLRLKLSHCPSTSHPTTLQRASTHRRSKKMLSTWTTRSILDCERLSVQLGSRARAQCALHGGAQDDQHRDGNDRPLHDGGSEAAKTLFSNNLVSPPLQENHGAVDVPRCQKTTPSESSGWCGTKRTSPNSSITEDLRASACPRRRG